MRSLLTRLAPMSLINPEALARIQLEHDDAPEKGRPPTAAAESFWFEASDWRAAYRPYDVRNGVLRVPVRGTLYNNFGWAMSFATGYDYIQKAVERGLADEDVHGIALVIDSPGGEVAGNYDLVDSIYAARGAKPIRAFAADSAYSAAYNIASAADSITVTRSGGVGSIGVVTMHLDMSGALAKEGFKVTFIYAGKHKVDGNPFEPLPEDVRARVQGRIDALYSEFVASVARNRGMDEGAVRATEALTFSAAEAVSNGLADSVGALDASLADFEAEILNRRRSAMAEKDAAIEAAAKKGYDDGFEAGLTLAKTEERQRVGAILSSEESKGREALALEIALESDLSADAAKKLLAKAPKAEAPAAKNPFDAAMDATPNPNVGEGGGSAIAEDDPDGVKSVLALAKAARLPGFKSTVN